MLQSADGVAWLTWGDANPNLHLYISRCRNASLQKVALLAILQTIVNAFNQSHPINPSINVRWRTCLVHMYRPNLM